MNVSRQIGWSNESNLLYQILKQITRLTSVVFGLKPKYKVFTGLVSQSGSATEDSINSGDLTIGVTYSINEESIGMDFTNVGAPNNNIGTRFIAIGTTPNNWGEGATYTLAYSAGAPVVLILENTIGNIWFEYLSAGTYSVNSNNLFTENKTAIDIDAFASINVTNDSYISNETNFLQNNFNIYSTKTGSLVNDVFLKNRLEIKVYY